MMTAERVAELQFKADTLWRELCDREKTMQPLRSQWSNAQQELRDAEIELKVRKELEATL